MDASGTYHFVQRAGCAVPWRGHVHHARPPLMATDWCLWIPRQNSLDRDGIIVTSWKPVAVFAISQKHHSIR
jgi:hypothetical protein